MDGEFEGGERESLELARFKRNQYRHLKPFVASKLWRQHDRIAQDAARRVRHQTEVEEKMRQGYRTLFYGLKRNHPHNVAIVHPIAFILRRVIFSVIIVFLARSQLNVLFGCLILLATCIFMMLLVVLESQWDDDLINK